MYGLGSFPKCIEQTIDRSNNLRNESDNEFYSTFELFTIKLFVNTFNIFHPKFII